MRSLIVAALAALSFASAADAKVCYDAHHHFMRCAPVLMPHHMGPPPHVVVAPKRCRDAHGHFMACHK